MTMRSDSITTITRMLASLPAHAQERVVEHVREYIEDLQDENRWDRLFDETGEQLAAAAQNARQEIAEGQARPLDPDQL